ncbi:hypothetical protein AAG906_035499 [Vitis piasezkii]
MAESEDLTQSLISQTNSILNDLTTKMTEVVEMYIFGKDKLGYINGDSPQLPETNPSLRRWRTENAIVKGWLINSMDPSLIANFIRFPTAKQVWDSAATTYFDGTDSSQVYDLQRRVTRTDTTLGGVMISKGIKGSHYQTTTKLGTLSLSRGKSKTKPPFDGMKCTHCGNSKYTRDTYFKLHGYPDWWNDFQARKKRETSANDDHTRRASVVTCDTSLSLIPQVESSHDPGTSGTSGKALHISTHNNDDDWILDSGATDHMTFDSNDFSNVTQPRRSCVTNANGVTYPVTGAGTVILSPSLSLSNTLLVPSLSNRLMSVSQVTTDLNCVVVMYSIFCLLQDILTKEIIGRGTKRGGLYYIDDFSSEEQITCTTWLTYFNSHGILHETSFVHLLNRMPTKVLQFQTSIKVLSYHVSLPNVLMIHPWIFGCVLFVHIHKNQRTKLDPCVVRCLFLGDNLVHPNDGNDMVEDVGDNLAHPNNGNDMVEPPRTEVEPILESSEDVESDESLHSLVPNDPPSENIPEIPSSVEEALSNSKWAQAIKEELEAVLPEGRKMVGCKWIFSIKYKADGSIDRYKARVLLSLAANLDWPLHQLDMKNAFLHGDLEEEIYMDLPPGYTATSEAKIACRLQRALKYGFQQSNSDHTLFLKHQVGKITALIVYVDDMIIIGDDIEEISRLQEQLSTEFEMKNLGGLKYFLGIEVARSRQGIFLSQRKYILDLLAEVGLLGCKPVDIPIRYQWLVGKLIYLSHTQPDIAYVVSVVSQFMHCPSEDHMDAVMRILRYLKSSPGKGLMFSKNGHLNVVGYTDADWAGNITDRKSTSGAEAEFRGMVKGICELLWLKKLLVEIGVAPSSEMNLFCDNKAAIAISHNPVQHDRTKHVEVDRNFIKQNLEEKIIQLPFVKSEDQLADILTKAVSARNYYNSLDKLGIRDIYAPT